MNHTPLPSRRGLRRGLTLTELALSIGVVGLILLAGQSAVTLAGATAARSAKGGTAAAACAAASQRMTDELSTALSITSATATSVTFTVPDRTGDNSPDTVTYSWSGTVGDPLMRSLNGGPPTPILGGVRSLAFSYSTATKRLASGRTTSAETLLASNPAPSTTNTKQVQSGKIYGLVLRPIVPADAESWNVTRVRLKMRSKSAGGQTEVQLRRVASSRPASATLDSSPVADTALSAAYDWKDCTFTNANGLTPGESIAVVLNWVAGSNACEVEFQDSGTCPPGDALYESSDLGGNWVRQNGQTLVYEVYGTVARPATAQAGSVYTGVRVRAVAADSREIAADIPLVNQPVVP
ncbi:MAG: hypothetical protein JNK25_09400 [Phycisphaerae bacterium]|nr:hypothetical protein [Phycisphaerae bacterium]